MISEKFFKPKENTLGEVGNANIIFTYKAVICRVGRKKTLIQGCIVMILCWLSMFLLLKSFKIFWYAFAIKKRIWKYLDSFLRRDLDSQDSWFLTSKWKSEMIILNACLIPRIRIQISWFLSRPFKLNLALLSNKSSCFLIACIFIFIWQFSSLFLIFSLMKN